MPAKRGEESMAARLGVFGIKHPVTQHALLGIVAIIAIVGLVLLFIGASSTPTARPVSIGVYTPGAETAQAQCIWACDQAYPYGSQDNAACRNSCLREQEALGTIGGVRPPQVTLPS